MHFTFDLRAQPYRNGYAIKFREFAQNDGIFVVKNFSDGNILRESGSSCA
jgi:hypothetical protein